MIKATMSFLIASCLITMNVSAQAKAPENGSSYTVTDSSSFTGKYKYEGMPFEFMEISIREGKIFYSGGEYSGFLAPLKDKKDAFDASGQAVFTFVRNAEGKATDLQIDYQGQIFSGKKEEKN